MSNLVKKLAELKISTYEKRTIVKQTSGILNFPLRLALKCYLDTISVRGNEAYKAITDYLEKVQEDKNDIFRSQLDYLRFSQSF
jgi:hypothetical protein